MKIKCENCGYCFPEEEVDSYEEHIGDPFGFPAYEGVYVCPHCKSLDLVDVDEEEELPDYD